MKKRTLIFALCLFTAVSLFTRAADGPELVGPYKTIDIRLSTETIKALAQAKGDDREVMIKGITDKPENFAPPVLYLTSRVLFDSGKKDDAMFWFYAAYLRAQIDANICADKSVRRVVDAMNVRFGQQINQYAFQDIPKLTNTVEKVVAWEAKTPCHYDRRWINLEGVNATMGETNAPLSQPHDQWEKIRKSTREDYRSTFYTALANLNKAKQQK